MIEQLFLDPEGAKTRAQEVVMRKEYCQKAREERKVKAKNRRG